MTSSPRECALCGKKDGSLKACSRCETVCYCSKEHQRDHWKDHKKTCKPKGAVAAAPVSKDVQRHLVENEADAASVEVLWEDQERINLFGRLNTRLTDVRVEIRRRKALKEHLDDAEGEIEGLLDDDACLMKVGEVFVDISNDDAEVRVRSMKEEETGELKKLEKQCELLETEMNELKTKLYSKFGKNINLEMDETD